MNTKALSTRMERMPFLFDDFFSKPWNDWFNSGLTSRVMNVPAVNISERKDDFLVTMAAPGLKKEDFKIDLEGSILTISSEKEEESKEEDEKFTRKEYSYSSFERSFTLPEEVNQNAIEAQYKEGVLNLTLPKKEEAKRMAISKQITVK